MNYSEQQTKLETPAFFSLLFRVSLCRLVLASTFLLAFGTIQRRGESVRLNHISALFDPDSCLNAERKGIREFQNYIWKTLIKFELLVVETFLEPNSDLNLDVTYIL